MKKFVLTLLCTAWICGLKAADNQSAEYVDLGLPSGTLWKSTVEDGLFTHEQAVAKFSAEQLPSKEQWSELKDSCQWKWNGNGYTVIGMNGDSIAFPAAGYKTCEGDEKKGGSYGAYWSSSYFGGYKNRVWTLFFETDKVSGEFTGTCLGRSVRLIKAQ